MKKLVLILLSVVLLLISLPACKPALKSEGFAMYLTREDITPDQMSEISNLSQVALAGQAIIGIDDIITYNTQTHELKLTSSAFEGIFQLEVPVRGKSFVVCVDKNPVYWGAFWTTVSSISFGGITIWKSYSSSSEPYIITFELGYPSSSFYGGEDPRNKPEIINSFKQNGKLITALNISTVNALPHSTAGYELYSWQENAAWHFTLITGTDRNKNLQEIVSDPDFISEAGWENIHCIGLNEVKTALSKVPPNEWVTWRDGAFVQDGNKLSLPPQDITDDIKDYALGRDLNFNVTQ